MWCSMVVTRQQAHYSHVQVRGCGQSVVAQGGECGVLWWSLAVVIVDTMLDILKTRFSFMYYKFRFIAIISNSPYFTVFY